MKSIILSLLPWFTVLTLTLIPLKVYAGAEPAFMKQSKAMSENGKSSMDIEKAETSSAARMDHKNMVMKIINAAKDLPRPTPIAEIASQDKKKS